MALFEKTILYYDNAARRARTGDDGTSYAVSGGVAIAHPSDPYKVRGDVHKIGDIATLSGLTGCQLVMDTTGHRYDILSTTANPYASAIRTLLAPYAENNHGQMVKVGSYVYTVCNKTVLEINPAVSPRVVVRRLLLPTSDAPFHAYRVVATDGTFLYIGTLSGTLHIIRIGTLAIEWSGTLPGTVGGINAMACDTNNLFVVAGGAPDGGDSVEKYSLGPNPQLLATLDTDPAGADPIDSRINSLHAGYTDGHLYAAGKTNGMKGCILKINKSTMAFVSRAVSTTNIIDDVLDGIPRHGPQLCVKGTDIFTIMADETTTQGRVLKASLTSFPATLTEGTCSAGENHPAGIVTDGTNLFVYTNTSAIRVVKFNTTPTRTGSATLSAGENGTAGGGNMLYDGAAVLIGCTTSPAILVECTTAPARTSALTYYAGLADAGEGVAQDGQYVYIAYPYSPSRIGKWDLVSGQLVAQLALNTGENSVNALAIGADGYLYALCGTTPAILVKIDIATSVTAMTRVSAVTLSAGEGPGNALKLSGSKGYCGCGSTAGKIVKVNLTDMARDDVITFTAGRNDVRALEIVGADIYAGCYSNHLVKSSLSTFTETAAVDTGNPVIELCSDASYIYTIMNAATNNIRRTAISGFSLGTALSTSSGAAPACCVVVGADLQVFSDTDTFDRINTADWHIDESITTTALDTVSQLFRRMFLYDNYVWLVNEGGSGAYAYSSLIQADPYQSLTLKQRFQTVDVGDMFTVRAALVCAQQSAASPVSLLADNALSPVAMGLVNTAFSLRMHLLNFLRDGGFESGAFSPHWTAGANWVIESATELEGAFSASWDLVASTHLQQSGTGRLEQGKTYRLVFKAKSVTANPTAGAITVQLKQAGTGANLDADAAGTQPAITTAAAWFAIDFTPDFATNDWYVKLLTDHTKANGATEVTVDEFYLYEKLTATNLIIGRHNLVGKSGLLVRSWKCSPLRSTAGADEYTEIKASFAVDTADTYEAALTASSDPVFEMYIPAASGWAPQIGELFIGPKWQVPRYPGATDPYEINDDGLRVMKLGFRNLAPGYRTAQVKTISEKIAARETIWVKWNTDIPMLMISAKRGTRAPYTPTRIDLELDLVEVL